MEKTTAPHIALLPSAGMGHLSPFLKLASLLVAKKCLVTLITPKTRVSAAESSHISFFLSANPEVNLIEFQTVPIDSSNPTTDDPFFLQWKAIKNSVHNLYTPLSSISPPLSAIFTDFVAASTMNQMIYDLGVTNYVLSTTSVEFLCLVNHLPAFTSDTDNFSSSSREVKIPDLTPLQKSSIPLPFFSRHHPFTAQLISDVQAISKSKGILMNTFTWFAQETLSAVNNGRVAANLPPILPIGPLHGYNQEKGNSNCLPWLDNQPPGSVIYVSFGSRTAMSKDQIRELEEGLQMSGYRFLWVVKTSKVDKEDKEELEDLLGKSTLEKLNDKGMIVKGWVNQEEILQHPAIGGFMSHCGWNSVMEAAWRGIPILAWPQHGDQRVNAGVMEKAGLGIWDRGWGWHGEGLVSGEKIGKRIVEMMEDEKLKAKAREVEAEARKAMGIGGSSEKTLSEVLESLKEK